MADLSFRDRLPDYRNQYSRLKSKDAKKRFLDRIQAAYGYERKYPIKKLSGNRRYKPHRGRARVFGADFEEAALALHRASGWMCAPYLKAAMPKLLLDWEAVAGPVDRRLRDLLLSVGESTFARLNVQSCARFTMLNADALSLLSGLGYNRGAVSSSHGAASAADHTGIPHHEDRPSPCRPYRRPAGGAFLPRVHHAHRRQQARQVVARCQRHL